ncbi:MAG: VWA domain-containing protein [Candidatus Aminicenantales bacterium]
MIRILKHSLILGAVAAFLIPLAITQTQSDKKAYWPCGQDVSKEIDRVPVSIKIELKKKPAKVGDEGVVDITLMPNIDVKSLLFSVSFAGGGEAKLPEGFEKIEPVKPYIEGLKPSSHFERELADLRKGKPRSFSASFVIKEKGYGYIMGSVRAPAREKPVVFSESSVLFYLATKEEAYFSYHSILDLDVQKLIRDLTKKGLSKEEIEKEVKRLKRRGAKVKKRVSYEYKSGANEENEQESYNSVTVNGTVRFTDVNGATHPVRFVTVEVWDEETGPADELVAFTTTDNSGDYSVTFDDNDGDGTGRDIYVIVKAEGDTVRVEDYGANDDVATGVIWEVDSLPALVDVVDGSVITIDITATNNMADPNNVAFEAYEAVNYLSRYLSDLGEPLPAQLNVRYPRPGTDGSNFSPTLVFIRLAGTDVHDWDNIHHEYGHYIQHVYNTANNPGGPHSSCNNLCVTKANKDEGIRMAWAESWPTFFGIMTQAEIGLDALGIPNLGDTNYTDTKPNPANNLDYDLEIEDGCSQGEGNERALMRIFWDLYDAVDDGADIGVSLSAQELWDIITDNQPHTFSAFWNDLTAIYTEEEKIAFGAICAQYNTAPEINGPADNTVFAGGAAPNFQWSGNMGCDTGGNARYSVRFYNDSFTSLIWASPWQSGTTFTPTDEQRDLIFVGPDGNLRWVVASKDLSAPQTGVYYSDSRTVVDNFDVPDRNPVDIILALDVSGSMGGTVPGSDTGLKKIELLQQAVEVFVRTWAMHAIEGDRIGVIYFSTNTSSLPGTPPILMDVAANEDDVVDDVNAKTHGGCTAIGGALQVGYNALENGDNKKVIILFSDGEQTTNPFVDEEGVPSKLKITVITAGSTLPFDAYWCSESTAKAPDGTTIVPDGQFLHEHDVEIHSIGVGVNGASFEELIERISDETEGLHHFTSAPDEDLDIFFTNDLINSLKTGTLEIVKTDKGTLGSGDMKTISVPVNRAAESLTIVLSWKNELNYDALKLDVRAPDGSTVIPSKVSKGDFFAINNYKFPAKSRDKEVDHWGNWTVKILCKIKGDFVKYQLSSIVDEPCFYFDFDFPRKDYSTGDPIKLTATLTQNGKPLLLAEGVWVDVISPAQSNGNLLADCLPFVQPEDYREYKRDIKNELYPRLFDVKLAVLLSDPEAVSMMKAKVVQKIQLFDDGRKEYGDLKANDGIYSNVFTNTYFPGSYEFRLHILASSECGRVERTESMSTLVSINTFDPEKSSIKAIQVKDDMYAISVRPADRFGNLLGPGNERFINIFATGGELEGDVTDQFDGSYEQLILVKPGENPRITVVVKGKLLIHAPLLALVKEGKVPALAPVPAPFPVPSISPQVKVAAPSPLAHFYSVLENFVVSIEGRPSKEQKKKLERMVDSFLVRAKAKKIKIKTDIKKLFNLWYLYPEERKYRESTIKALENIKKQLKIR